MKLSKIFILALVIFEFASAGNHKPIFQIKPQNIDFLRYFFISNLYDSAKVIYKFGEVKLISGDNTNFINLVHSSDYLNTDSSSIQTTDRLAEPLLTIELSASGGPV